MPSHLIPLSDAEHALFDRVRREQGLSTVADAVAWLAKTKLRKGMHSITGRRRGPRLVASQGQQQ